MKRLAFTINSSYFFLLDFWISVFPLHALAVRAVSSRRSRIHIHRCCSVATSKCQWQGTSLDFNANAKKEKRNRLLMLRNVVTAKRREILFIFASIRIDESKSARSRACSWYWWAEFACRTFRSFKYVELSLDCCCSLRCRRTWVFRNWILDSSMWSLLLFAHRVRGSNEGKKAIRCVCISEPVFA